MGFPQTYIRNLSALELTHERSNQLYQVGIKAREHPNRRKTPLTGHRGVPTHCVNSGAIIQPTVLTLLVPVRNKTASIILLSLRKV